jgi:hypothetical protein
MRSYRSYLNDKHQQRTSTRHVLKIAVSYHDFVPKTLDFIHRERLQEEWQEEDSEEVQEEQREDTEEEEEEEEDGCQQDLAQEDAEAAQWQHDAEVEENWQGDAEGDWQQDAEECCQAEEEDEEEWQDDEEDELVDELEGQAICSGAAAAAQHPFYFAQYPIQLEMIAGGYQMHAMHMHVAESDVDGWMCNGDEPLYCNMYPTDVVYNP